MDQSVTSGTNLLHNPGQVFNFSKFQYLQVSGENNHQT